MHASYYVNYSSFAHLMCVQDFFFFFLKGGVVKDQAEADEDADLKQRLAIAVGRFSYTVKIIMPKGWPMSANVTTLFQYVHLFISINCTAITFTIVSLLLIQCLQDDACIGGGKYMGAKLSCIVLEHCVHSSLLNTFVVFYGGVKLFRGYYNNKNNNKKQQQN